VNGAGGIAATVEGAEGRNSTSVMGVDGSSGFAGGSLSVFVDGMDDGSGFWSFKSSSDLVPSGLMSIGSSESSSSLSSSLSSDFSSSLDSDFSSVLSSDSTSFSASSKITLV